MPVVGIESGGGEVEGSGGDALAREGGKRDNQTNRDATGATGATGASGPRCPTV